MMFSQKTDKNYRKNEIVLLMMAFNSLIFFSIVINCELSKIEFGRFLYRIWLFSPQKCQKCLTHLTQTWRLLKYFYLMQYFCILFWIFLVNLFTHLRLTFNKWFKLSSFRFSCWKLKWGLILNLAFFYSENVMVSKQFFLILIYGIKYVIAWESFSTVWRLIHVMWQNFCQW